MDKKKKRLPFAPQLGEMDEDEYNEYMAMLTPTEEPYKTQMSPRSEGMGQPIEGLDDMISQFLTPSRKKRRDKE